jgi:hypothetical protein
MRSLVAVLLVAFGGTATAQQPPWTLVVTQPATIGVDADTATAFAELVRGELARQPNLRVIPRAQTPPDPCGDATCAAAIAQRAGAHGAVAATLTRLGDKVVVQYVHAGADGRVLIADRATAATVGDLDPLSTRVAASVAAGRPLEATIGTSTVTAQEARMPARRNAAVTTGVDLGVLAPVANSYGGSSAMTDLGFFGLMELHEFAASGELNFIWTVDRQDAKPSAFSFQLNLGGRYFIDPESDTGVYVGGGVGLRTLSVDTKSATIGTQSAVGMGAFADVGVVFLRTSDLHVIIDLRYDADIFGVDRLDPGGAHGVLATLGLSYAKFWHIF